MASSSLANIFELGGHTPLGDPFGFLPEGPPDMSGAYNMWKLRQSQITDFSNTLDQALSGYKTAYNNFANYSMNQFAINNVPGFANAGLTTNSGAYNAEMARQAAMYQNQANVNSYQFAAQNANAVNAARAGAGTMNMASMFANGAVDQYNINNQNSQMVGQAFGKLGMMALGGATGNPFMGAGIMGNPFQSPNQGAANMPKYNMPTMGANGYFGSQGNLDLWGTR